MSKKKQIEHGFLSLRSLKIPVTKKKIVKDNLVHLVDIYDYYFPPNQSSFYIDLSSFIKKFEKVK